MYRLFGLSLAICICLGFLTVLLFEEDATSKRQLAIATLHILTLIAQLFQLVWLWCESSSCITQAEVYHIDTDISKYTEKGPDLSERTHRKDHIS